ncbi:sigma-70 family RNA polymerase sigma factor [Sphingomonas sp. HF-S4]|uniref:Sigma-70 family RNA polymerase sigma factor n=1 Tax=Sphingomonas agrestis TaxID=3080540 RepID=A0ABU3Y7B0_9SPHN|nr:sigma-70 family RNA polymerase sigma factor [Sphingomonas sp. HF-S4]MDV3457196.1 sigma-70 family RNA polymerase sigma factor [Sphingomonas sp. HF-S4]
MQIEDALLVVRCQLGERDAFEALIVRWAGPVAGYARRVSEDSEAAAELSQEIWVRVLRGIDRLKEPRCFRAWLFGIAHRASIDALRRRYKAPSPVHDLDLPEEDESFDEQDDIERMEAGLERLPPVEREILTLFYLHELTIEETAAALAVPAGTVKSRLHRARRLLRRELEMGDTL